VSASVLSDLRDLDMCLHLHVFHPRRPQQPANRAAVNSSPPVAWKESFQMLSNAFQEGCSG
jgi:hypothetical protein